MQRTSLTAAVFIAFSCLCATAPLVRAQTLDSQGDDAPYEERTVEVDGVSLRYLDFGGDGLTIVFTPALERNVEGYAELGALLQDDYRVLAVGRRDADSAISELGVRTHAQDLLGFLDALGIEQAVFAGNTEPAYRITYLVEQHPERVAGVIYLAGPPSAAGHLFKSPASGWPMLVRSWGLGEDFLEQDPYAYQYLEDEDASLWVPALTFVNPTGIRGVESWVFPLMEIGSPRAADDIAEMESSAHPAGQHYARLLSDVTFRNEQLARIPDPEAREYFHRLAASDSLQAEVERFHDEHILPAELAGWAAFRKTFGEHLRVVELDVPIVIGYEYRDAPELIEPHIRRFLEEVDARHHSQTTRAR